MRQGARDGDPEVLARRGGVADEGEASEGPEEDSCVVVVVVVVVLAVKRKKREREKKKR